MLTFLCLLRTSVDLTKSAFRKLSPSGTLKEGRIHGLQMYHYSNNPTPWDVGEFNVGEQI